MLAFRSLVVPADRGAHEPALGRRRLRRPHRGVREGLRALVDRASPTRSRSQSFVPLLMFAILFGLSMDYQVFLLSRVREHYAARRRQPQGGDRRARDQRPGDHLGGADHGHRLRQLHPQRRPDGEAVRRRARGCDRRRRDDRALPVGAGDDGAVGRSRTGGSRAGSSASFRTSASRARSRCRRCRRPPRDRGRHRSRRSRRRPRPTRTSDPPSYATAERRPRSSTSRRSPITLSGSRVTCCQV